MQKTELEAMKSKSSKRSTDHVEKMIKELKMERELSQQNIAEYSTKHYEQTRVIETLKDKIKLLDSTITQLSADAANEKETLTLESVQKVSDMEADLASKRHPDLKQQVKLRSKENKHLRQLSQMILDQRSEVEQFFLEALDQIKEEIRKKMLLEQKGTKLPVLRGGKQKVYADRVDLSDLNWEDRERVLRILFAKMNVGTTNTSWREPEDSQ